jgi:hypothetical protein
MKSCSLEKLQEKDGASDQENETLGEFPDSDKYSQKSGECTWYVDMGSGRGLITRCFRIVITGSLVS